MFEGMRKEMEGGTVVRGRGPTIGTQDNPAPPGVTVRTRIERGDRYSAPEVYNLEITLQEIVRGEKAWDRIKEQGAAEEARVGFEYILCSIRIGYFSRARGFAHSGEAYEISGEHFGAVGADGRTELERPLLLRQPDPPLIGTALSVNESREGWILLQVPFGEKAFLIFRREYETNQYGVWGPVWFRLEQV